MQSTAYMDQIRALVKNTDSSVKSRKSGKSGKKHRPSIVLAPRDTPVKRQTIHSPSTRQNLTHLAEQRKKLQNQLDAEEATVIASSVINYFFSTSLFLTRVCSQETKAAKKSFSLVTRDIEGIREKINFAAEEHNRRAAISDDLLVTEKKLTNDKDKLTDSLAAVKKNYDRKVVEITEKYTAKVSTRTML